MKQNMSGAGGFCDTNGELKRSDGESCRSNESTAAAATPGREGLAVRGGQGKPADRSDVKSGEGGVMKRCERQRLGIIPSERRECSGGSKLAQERVWGK